MHTDLQTLLPSQKIHSCTPLAQQGYSNQSYLLITDTQHYIVRKFSPSDIDRVQEYQIQARAHQAGIAPKPIALDTKRGIMLSKFVQGSHKKVLTAQQLAQLAETLTILHSLPYSGTQVPYRVDSSGIQCFAYDPVLCHNDLNPQNILWDTHPILIDWEYAGLNDRYFDLAAVIAEFTLSATDANRLLQHYFTPERSWHQEKLDAYTQLYHDVCALWWMEHNTP